MTTKTVTLADVVAESETSPRKPWASAADEMIAEWVAESLAESPEWGWSSLLRASRLYAVENDAPEFGCDFRRFVPIYMGVKLDMKLITRSAYKAWAAEWALAEAIRDEKAAARRAARIAARNAV